MDLSLLRDSLPPNNFAQGDRDLLDKFKAAAHSVTTLYKSSLRQSKHAYNEGYAACLRDVLNFMQAGVSAEGRMSELGGHDGSGALGLNLNFDVDGDGMTIGRVMDWVENRLEAIAAEEEDVEGPSGSGREEDEDKTRKRRAKAKSVTRPLSTSNPVPSVSAPSMQDAPIVQPPMVPIASTPSAEQQPSIQSTLEPPGPSSPLSARCAQLQSQGSSVLTRSRSKVDSLTRLPLLSTIPPSFLSNRIRETPIQPLDSSEDYLGGVGPDSELGQVIPESAQALIGSKRRHAAMVSEITNTPLTAGPANSSDQQVISRSGMGSTRRRTKGSSAGLSRTTLGTTDMSDSMDIEDVEPARKRVARR